VLIGLGFGLTRLAVLQAASGPSLESIGGYSVETGNKPFDPLKIADWIPADRLRASELANGRCVYIVYSFSSVASLLF
jgi:hypothetical protein